MSLGKNNSWRKCLTVFLLGLILPTFLVPPSVAQTLSGQLLDLPVPGAAVPLSAPYYPPVIAGMAFDPKEPFAFTFLVDTGDARLGTDELKKQSDELVRYFLAALATPEEDLWVNLSPYEQERIIPENLGKTALGRGLLAEDYLLKQITASLFDPSSEFGKDLWARIYAQAKERYSVSEIPAESLSKIWIVPQYARLYVKGGRVLVTDTSLKVMSRADHMALEGHAVPGGNDAVNQVIRDVVAPAVEKEVNYGKNFAQLRQICNSVILAAWYKKNLKESILAKSYMDKNQVSGIEIEDKQIAQKIYDRYLEALKKGVLNVIREDYDPVTQEDVPRKYFSGGTELRYSGVMDAAEAPAAPRGEIFGIKVVLDHGGDMAESPDAVKEELAKMIPVETRSFLQSRRLEWIKPFLQKGFLMNLVVYLKLNWQDLLERKSGDAFREGNIIKDFFVNDLLDAQEPREVYPLLRQMIKETDRISSSKLEKINALMKVIQGRIDIKSFGVSTHEGFDLLNPTALAWQLQNVRQKFPVNEPRYSGYEQAMTELESIVNGIISGGIDISKDLERFELSPSMRGKIMQAEASFNQGRQMEALLGLTEVRGELKGSIVELTMQARALYRSDVRRYGDHINEAQRLIGQVRILTEVDILLEKRIVDYYKESFADVRADIDRTKFSDINHIKKVLNAVYIIVRNIDYWGEYSEVLSYAARSLESLLQKKEYSRLDHARMYGLFAQVQIVMTHMAAELDDEAKWRVEAIQSKKAGHQLVDTPESLSITDDLLRTTLLSQFTEEYINHLKGLFRGELSVGGEAFVEDASLQEQVVRIMNIRQDRNDQRRVFDLKQIDPDTAKLLGAKTYGIAVLDEIGLKIPEGFVLNAKAYAGKKLPMEKDLVEQLEALEKRSGKKLGDPKAPLLLSLRSSFPVSLPGDFHTVVDLGMNDVVFEGLKEKYGEEFALRAYLRFKTSFMQSFERDIQVPLIGKDDSVDSLRAKMGAFDALLAAKGFVIPQDPWEQIDIIAPRIAAGSSEEKFRYFLALQGVSEDIPVNVIGQEMVFGDLDDGSYTAVVHTRNTLSGGTDLDVELAYRSQGPDLVGEDRPEIEVAHVLPPEDEKLILDHRRAMEKVFGPTELEITKQGKVLYFLQARAAKLTPKATVAAVEELVRDGVIAQGSGRKMIAKAKSLIVDRLITGVSPVVYGAPVAGDGTSGQIALTFEQAREISSRGGNAILVLIDKPPREINVLYNQMDGVITRRGGSAQHFAVWMRRLNKPYISMVNDMEVSTTGGTVVLGGKTFHEGDWITMDGSTGKIYEGDLLKDDAKDSAMGTSKEADVNGGIDLNSDHYQMDATGERSVPLLDAAGVVGISDLHPVILNVFPVKDPAAFIESPSVM